MQSVETAIKPFNGFKSLDGYHCWTNALAKVFDYYGHPVSEEMLLGIGCGMGFIYWEQKGLDPFIGGRDNVKTFVQDLCSRTGVNVKEIVTSSSARAEKTLLSALSSDTPVVLRVDMAFLPYFDFGGEEYHFGHHAVVACGYENDRVLISDMDNKASGLKKGFLAEMTLEELRQARGSTFKPFPPKNTWFEFDFSSFTPLAAAVVREAIAITARNMLEPPIGNLGIKGIRKTATSILKWPERFQKEQLLRSLFSLYIMIEIGGSGGGAFRYMYARFLREAFNVLGDDSLARTAEIIAQSGKVFSDIAKRFKTVLTEEIDDLTHRIEEASALFTHIAELEEEAFSILADACSNVT